MYIRAKELPEQGRPTPHWLAGMMIGLTLSTLAGSAIMFGASMALGQAVTRGK
jgi:hypothetical protein